VSKGGRRSGAGRPRQRAVVEQFWNVDVRKLYRNTLLCEARPTLRLTAGAVAEVRYDQVALRYVANGDVRQQMVGIERTRCNYGGDRPWFRCPSCSRRVAILYLRGALYLCRHCHSLAYRTQREDLCDRAWSRQRKIERRLGKELSRPKGMRQVTYDRLLHQIRLCELMRDEWLIRATGRLTAELQRTFAMAQLACRTDSLPRGCPSAIPRALRAPR
jgi:hypothetical protein